LARWLLTEPHYIKVLDCFWEQTETDRVTGRQKKKKYPVPMHLDPKCAQDWNNKPGSSSGHISRGGNSWDEGFITVCQEGKGEAHDYVFVGDPTPGMEPIDDEARAISGKFDWGNVADPFYGSEMTFAERMIFKMQDEAKAQQPAQNEALNETLTMLAQVMAQNTALLAKLSERR
jgi:hypothetical protein